MIVPSQSHRWTREELDLVVAGDQDAVRHFIRWFHALVLVTIPRVGIVPEDIDDFVQDRIIELFREQARVLREWDPRKGASLKTYLARHVTFRLQDCRRRQASAPVSAREDAEGGSLLEQQRAGGASPEENVAYAELVRLLEASCSDEDLVVFRKSILDDHPAEDVAQELGITVVAAYQRKSRLIIWLQKRWRQLRGEG